jgi:hypothetical protein
VNKNRNAQQAQAVRLGERYERRFPNAPVSTAFDTNATSALVRALTRD